MSVAVHRWLNRSVPLLTERWDAETFVPDVDVQHDWTPLRMLKVRISEGVRLSSHESQLFGLYRPSSIRSLMLEDRDLSRMPDSWERLSLVGAGDVVVSKFLPLSAAWVSPTTPRRPVDANCLRIIGLHDEDGFWLANVLEHPYYQALTTRLAAGSALPRLGQRDLRELKIPATPTEMKALVAEWTVVQEVLAKTRQTLEQLRSDVNEWIEDSAPTIPESPTPVFYPPSALRESWLPVALTLQSFQAEASRNGWIALENFLTTNIDRLREWNPNLRVLRLSDSCGGFEFDLPEIEAIEHSAYRIYEQPLIPGEVLLSILGSAPKVILHHPPKSATVWVSDHWVRFGMRSHAGTLALLLMNDSIILQLAMATTGVARQFVSRSDVAGIRIPWPQESIARRWHEGLCAILEQSAEAQAKAADIRLAVRALVEDRMGRIR